MKRGTKIALLAGASLCIVGAALYGVGSVAGGRAYVGATNLNSLRDTAEYESLKEDGYFDQLTEDEIKLDAFQTLSIDCENLDVSIVPSDKKYSYLSYEVEADKKGNNPLSYEVEDQTLTLKEDNGRSAGSYVHVDISFFGWLIGGESTDYEEYHKNQVTLHLGEDAEIKNSNIVLGDGDLSVEGMNSKAVTWELGYGDLTVTDCKLSDGTVTVKDGDILSDNVTSQDVEWVNQYGDWNAKNCALRGGKGEMSDGDLILDRSSWTDTELTLSYGDLEGKHIALGNVEVIMKDGDVELDSLTLSGENAITSQYGDVDIKLTSECSEQIVRKELGSDAREIYSLILALDDGTMLNAECRDGEIVLK